MAKNKPEKTFQQTKKELKKELATKIETALPDIKVSLGEKKFNKRIKKVTKLLIEGMHLNGKTKKINKKPFSANGLNSKSVVADTVTA